MWKVLQTLLWCNTIANSGVPRLILLDLTNKLDLRMSSWNRTVFMQGTYYTCNWCPRKRSKNAKEKILTPNKMFKLLKTSVQGAKKKEIPSRINTIKTTPGLSLVKILLMTYKANIPKAPSKNDRREVEKKKKGRERKRTSNVYSRRWTGQLVEER